MIRDTEMKEEVIDVVEADASPYYTIEQLWAMMPESNKKYYNNSIEYYRHRKLVQALLLK
jgi:hypothetical protein